jgi:hypothetical protein
MILHDLTPQHKTRTNTASMDTMFPVTNMGSRHSKPSSPVSQHLSPTSRLSPKPIYSPKSPTSPLSPTSRLSPMPPYSPTNMPKPSESSHGSLDIRYDSLKWGNSADDIERPVIAKGRELGTFEQEAAGLGIAQDVHPLSARFTERPMIAKRRRVENSGDRIYPSGFFLRPQEKCFTPEMD